MKVKVGGGTVACSSVSRRKLEPTESVVVIHCCWMYDYMICTFDVLEIKC